MGHQLIPRSGTYMSALEVAQRLSREFRHVVIDEARGRAEALSRAQWIEDANPAVFLGSSAQAAAFAQRLRSLSPGEAAWIQFGDRPDFTKAITVLPEEAIKFGYTGAEEEKASKDLVERCAKALDAELVEI